MGKSITPDRIKQNNRNLIYQFIYQRRNVSQQEIAYELRLSRPTVTANLTSMEAEGLICKNGQIRSELVGRKASAYSVVPNYRVSIGVEILKEEVKMIAIDLYGEKLGHRAFEISYKNNEAYFDSVSERILHFTQSLGLQDEQVLGVGFALQALISADQRTVVYGKILSCSGLNADVFSQRLPYPCIFIHDANSAAISELWVSPTLQNAFYLSLGRHLGAAVISEGAILTGKHGHSSTIEHMQMEPDGKKCYCGQHGCMETLCSLSALLKKNETLDSFFEALRRQDNAVQKRWDDYRTNLARAINLLHLVHDTDFILGGYLAPYLTEADIRFLHDAIREMTPFEEPADFLHISRMPEHNISIGAALPFIMGFLGADLKASSGTHQL